MGYQFEETLAYKERITRLLNLNVTELQPDPDQHALTQKKQLWGQDPDKCCHINKVEPLQQVKNRYKV